MGVVTAAHVLSAVLALASAVVLMRPSGRSGVTHLRWAAVGTVVWTLCVASVTAEGIHAWHQILWFPSVAFTAGALLLWAGEFSHFAWSPPRLLVAMWLAAPTLILVVRIAWGHDARFPLFVANTVYCFGVLAIAAVWVSRRSRDASLKVRLISGGILVTAVGILVAEAFRANVTDMVVAVLITVLTVVRLRGDDDLRGRPSPDLLIDDLGALLFVFDRDQRLVDLNAPARHFYGLRGAPPPALGVEGSALLGADLRTLDTVFVELAVGARTVPFSGYVQRLPSHSSPSQGWVCLLRRTTAPPSDDDDDDDDERRTRRAVMARLPGHDPVTSLLSERAFDHAITTASSVPDASEVEVAALVVEAADPTVLTTVARAIATTWEHRRETITIGRCGPLRVAVVVRDLPDPELRTWYRESLDGPGVLAVTRAGTLEQGAALVAEALNALNPSRGRHPS